MKARAILSLSFAGAALVGSMVPALAYWQFAWQDPPGERKTSAHFATEKECQAVLKKEEQQLEKKYPKPEHFPLAGSCEEYH